MTSRLHIVFLVAIAFLAGGIVNKVLTPQGDAPPAQSAVSLDIIADYERRLESADAALARAEQDAIREELYLRSFIPDKQDP